MKLYKFWLDISVFFSEKKIKIIYKIKKTKLLKNNILRKKYMFISSQNYSFNSSFGYL